MSVANVSYMCARGRDYAIAERFGGGRSTRERLRSQGGSSQERPWHGQEGLIGRPGKRPVPSTNGRGRSPLRLHLHYRGWKPWKGKHMLRWLTRIAAPVVAIAMLGLATASRADTIQAHLESVVNNGDGTFDYKYQLWLTPGNGLTNTANFESGLIILDFVGLVGTPVVSANAGDLTLAAHWSTDVVSTGGGILSNESYSAITGLTTLIGDNPFSGVVGKDSLAYSNVVLKYGGGGLAVNLASDPARQLIDLTLTSTVGLYEKGTVTLSRDTGPGDTNIPVETYSIVAPVVPLPAAAWAGMALMGFISATKLRLSRRLQA
jgi:hypothetical protein